MTSVNLLNAPAYSNLTTEQQTLLNRVRLEESWKQALAPYLFSEDFQKLRQFLKTRQEQQATIFPPNPLIFNALNLTPLSRVKVVILGQDPYHGAQQANGLAFSVQRGIAVPPSLRNIYQELLNDLKIPIARHGDLTAWAKQGVLLLNSILTVEQALPTSHQNQGWEGFTDAIIDVVSYYTEHTVFMLWGSYAQKKGQRIDRARHLVLTGVHPSPLAANRGGFFGGQYFSKANQYLIQHHKAPIDWQLEV